MKNLVALMATLALVLSPRAVAQTPELAQTEQRELLRRLTELEGQSLRTPTPLIQKSTGGGGDTVPSPDPTILTTQASEKAVASLKELLESRINALEEIASKLEKRADERPAEIREEIDQLRILVQAEIKALSDLTSEQFKGVAKEFQGRDTAVAAALLAQKTSVDEQNKSNAQAALKSELSVTKEIDGIKTLLAADGKAKDDKITDLRDRLASFEGKGAGAAMLWSILGAIGGGVLALIGALIAVKNSFVPAAAPVAPIQYVIDNGSGVRRKTS